MEIIQAPNGTTKFIKPDFECKLYEEIEGKCFGRVHTGTRSFACEWRNGKCYYGVENSISEGACKTYNLILAPTSKYNTRKLKG